MKNFGNKLYKIVYSENARDDLPILSKNLQKTIRNAINERLIVDPVGFGKPLCGDLKGYRSLRVGDYRVVYKISQEKRTVSILKIAHRKYVYDEVH